MDKRYKFAIFFTVFAIITLLACGGGGGGGGSPLVPGGGGSSATITAKIFSNTTTNYFANSIAILNNFAYIVGSKSSSTNLDAFIIKIDLSDITNSVPVEKTFSNIAGGNELDQFNSIFISNNFLFITGISAKIPIMNNDLIALKLDPNLVIQNFGTNLGRDIDGDSNNDFAYVKDNIAGGNDEDAGYSIFVNNDVYITGRSWNSSNFDTFILKLDSNGTNETINNFSNIAVGNETDEALSITGDSSGNVFIAGKSRKAPGNMDAFIIKFDGINSDTFILDNLSSFGDSPDSYVTSICVDGNTLYATGSTKNTSTNYYDMFVAKCNDTSNFTNPSNWTAYKVSAVITGDKDVYPKSIKFANNNLYIGGYFVRSNNNEDGFVITLNPSTLIPSSTPYVIDLSSSSSDPTLHTEVNDIFIDGTNIYATGSVWTLNNVWNAFIYKIEP